MTFRLFGRRCWSIWVSVPRIIPRRWRSAFRASSPSWEVWGKPAADTYLDGLMVSDRPSRQGFPLEVASEILRLSMIHSTLQVQKPAAPKGGAGQFGSDFDDFAERRSSR